MVGLMLVAAFLLAPSRCRMNAMTSWPLAPHCRQLSFCLVLSLEPEPAGVHHVFDPLAACSLDPGLVLR
jgi:hypothetical protein